MSEHQKHENIWSDGNFTTSQQQQQKHLQGGQFYQVGGISGVGSGSSGGGGCPEIHPIQKQPQLVQQSQSQQSIPTQQNPTTGHYTMLSVGHGNYLKVYHNSDETMNYNSYELFSNKSFVPLTINNSNQPMTSTNGAIGSDSSIPLQGTGSENLQNNTNMFINQLVGNWTPNQSGTYSPFGETIQTLPTLNNTMNYGVGSPLMHQQINPMMNQQQLNNDMDSNEVEMIAGNEIKKFLEQNNDYILKQQQLKQQNQPIQTQKLSTASKVRIVAEVKPMRMSYSDVLSQNVEINDNTGASQQTSSQIQSQPSTLINNTPIKTAKTLNNTKNGNFDKKTNQINGGNSDNSEKKSGNGMQQSNVAQQKINWNSTKLDDEKQDQSTINGNSGSGKKRTNKIPPINQQRNKNSDNKKSINPNDFYYIDDDGNDDNGSNGNDDSDHLNLNSSSNQNQGM